MATELLNVLKSTRSPARALWNWMLREGGKADNSGSAVSVYFDAIRLNPELVVSAGPPRGTPWLAALQAYFRAVPTWPGAVAALIVAFQRVAEGKLEGRDPLLWTEATVKLLSRDPDVPLSVAMSLLEVTKMYEGYEHCPHEVQRRVEDGARRVVAAIHAKAMAWDEALKTLRFPPVTTSLAYDVTVLRSLYAMCQLRQDEPMWLLSSDCAKALQLARDCKEVSGRGSKNFVGRGITSGFATQMDIYALCGAVKEIDEALQNCVNCIFIAKAVGSLFEAYTRIHVSDLVVFDRAYHLFQKSRTSSSPPTSERVAKVWAAIMSHGSAVPSSRAWVLDVTVKDYVSHEWSPTSFAPFVCLLVRDGRWQAALSVAQRAEELDEVRKRQRLLTPEALTAASEAAQRAGKWALAASLLERHGLTQISTFKP